MRELIIETQKKKKKFVFFCYFFFLIEIEVRNLTNKEHMNWQRPRKEEVKGVEGEIWGWRLLQSYFKNYFLSEENSVISR